MARLSDQPNKDAYEGRERAAYEALMVWGEFLALMGGAQRAGPPADDPLPPNLGLSPLAAWAREGVSVVAGQDAPGTFSRRHHEIAALVISFDCSYSGFLSLHLPLTLACGLTPATISALRDRADEQLSDGARRIATFGRATIPRSL